MTAGRTAAGWTPELRRAMANANKPPRNPGRLMEPIDP